MKNKIFLSQEDQGGGSVHWEIKGMDDLLWDQGGNVCIRDCMRQVNLEFPSYNKSVYNRSLRKIDTFITCLTNFREQFIEDHNNRKRRYF